MQYSQLNLETALQPACAAPLPACFPLTSNCIQCRTLGHISSAHTTAISVRLWDHCYRSHARCRRRRRHRRVCIPYQLRYAVMVVSKAMPPDLASLDPSITPA